MRARAAALPLVLLAGCVAAPTASPPPEISFRPDPAGLAVLPSGLRMDFGRAPEGMIPILERALGRGEALPLAGCPAEISARIAWGGLELFFTDERFVGWRQGAARGGETCG